MKIFIAIPSTDYIHKNFVQCLFALQIKYPHKIVLSESSLVHVSRTRLLEEAIRTDCTHILWLDSDMVFDADILEKLIKAIDGKDMVSGVYFGRRPPFKPCIFPRVEFHLNGEIIVHNFNKKTNPIPENEIFEIGACGFGGVLMTTKLAGDVFDFTKGMPFGLLQNGIIGEDISFCIVAKRLGYKIYCDSSIQMKHITNTMIDYETYKMLGE